MLIKWLHVGIFQYTNSRYLLHPRVGATDAPFLSLAEPMASR
jgi:hypothetical protein